MTYPITAPAGGAYPLSTAWAPTSSFTSTDQNSTNGVGNYGWGAADSAPIGARVATTGAETYTIVSGSVTVINGATIDGVAVAVGDPILIKDAPAASGVGSLDSTQPGNGVYAVTAVAANISVARAATMSAASAVANPAGRVVFVRAGGTLNASTMWQVVSPHGVSTFTWGTTALQWAGYALIPLAAFTRDRTIVAVTTDGTLDNVPGYDVVAVVNGGATVTLPTAVGNNNLYQVKSLGTVTVGTTSSQTIDGSALPITIASGDSVNFIPFNGNWVIT